jgi:hypothetical protein
MIHGPEPICATVERKNEAYSRKAASVSGVLAQRNPPYAILVMSMVVAGAYTAAQV